LEPSHGPRFWALLEPYPKLERARGYLAGVAATAGLDIRPDEPEVVDAGDEPDEPAARPAGAAEAPEVGTSDQLWGADEVWRSDRPTW
jgi:hypothetical protein